MNIFIQAQFGNHEVSVYTKGILIEYYSLTVKMPFLQNYFCCKMGKISNNTIFNHFKPYKNAVR